jgi:CheY-like chemotaxis protein
VNRAYLLIDDNVEFAENLAEILRDDGAQVDIAHCGADALTRLASRRYDALVTDMRMPGMSGAEFLHAARRVDPQVPAVLLSAFSHEADLRGARRDGLLAVLSKPQQVPRLLEILRNARRGGTVVLLEDDVALSENLCELLSSRGLTVLPALDCDEVATFGGQPFVALVDLKVPGCEQGPRSCVAARFPGTPQLVITAYPEELSRPEEHEVFMKPFDTHALVTRLEQLYAQAVHP